VVGYGGVGNALRGDWLGHALHPVLTDLPLGCWTAAAVLDLTAWRRGRQAAQRLVGVGILLAVPTAASGLAEFATLRDRRSRRVAAVHAAGNIVALGAYVASWRARRRGHQVVGAAASMLGGLLAVGTGYLGGHLSFVRGAGHGARGRPNPAIALPEHAGQPGRVTDSWETVEIVTPPITPEQRTALHALPHHMVEDAANGSSPDADEAHTAFHLPPDELRLQDLRALSAEASRIAGAARLVYRGDDPAVRRLVERVNAG
jgi:uncharacterized membrane protein